MIETLLFPTKIYTGHIPLTPHIINDYKKWLEVERLITSPVDYATTHNGYQRALASSDVEPQWHKDVFLDINNLCSKLSLPPIRGSWIVSYDIGGYQDPHVHSNSTCTLVLNLVGEGELLLHDPRPAAVVKSEPYAEIIKYKPGDWIIFPGWLSHSSRPCHQPRDILVIDFK